MDATAVFAYAFLVGSIPTAYLVSRATKGIDIRKYGSGNVGASNVMRSAGLARSGLVAAFDVFAKGTGSVLVARALGANLEYQVAAALIAIIGHNWSIFLRLSGGRGVSVAFGSMALFAWEETALIFAAFSIGIFLFRSTALWTGMGYLIAPFFAIAIGEPTPIVAYFFALLLLTGMKRLLSNPGSAAPGTRWRDVALKRLVYDRDDRDFAWVMRTPEDSNAESGV